MKKLSLILVILSLAISFVLISQKSKSSKKTESKFIEINSDTNKIFSSTPIQTDLVIPSGQGNKQPMEIEKLAVNTLIVGEMARTEMEFVFKNPNNNELEGEFFFPLGEGKTITRLALEVNKRLREAVVVEKEKGRIAFESTVRKKIDPALLEWTKGNNFKARVFPIPAKGTKRIVIEYEEPLMQFDSELVYTLNLGIKKSVKEFNYEVEVLRENGQPGQKYNKLQGLLFNAEQGNHIAKKSFKNVIPNKFIAFDFPITNKRDKVYTERDGGNFYFSATTFPSVIQRAKPQSNHIGIYWDISHSEFNQDKTKEIEFLKNYLQTLKGIVTVDIIPFHIKLETKNTFSISNGNASELISFLKNLKYDGATNFDNLNFQNPSWQEILLVSDGIDTYGKESDLNSFTPIYCISNNETADFNKLKALSSKSGGAFINLKNILVEQSIKLMNNQLYRLMEIEFEEWQAEEIYPKTGIVSGSSFSITGKLLREKATLLLKFGIGNQVLEEKEVIIYKNPVKELIKNKWARNKLDYLMMESSKNESKITEHAKEYKLISPFTSLIVLDRLEDYLEHDIVPPREMQYEYYNKKKKITKAENKSKKDKIKKVKRDFEERIAWWNTQFKIPKIKKPVIIDTMNFTDTTEVALNFNSSTPPPPPPPEPELIEVVSDEMIISDGNSEEVALREFTIQNSDSRRGIFNRREQSSANGWNYNKSAQGGYRRGRGDYMSINENDKEIKLKKWKSDAKYLKEMEKSTSTDYFKTYYKLKNKNVHSPSFYLDMSSFFESKKELELAERVLSNLAELESENHELLRALAYKLQELKKYTKTIEILTKVVELRIEEPQSYRDLGLAYAKNNQPQQAIETLYKIIEKPWQRFEKIEQIVLNEINQIIASHPEVNTEFMNQELIKNLPVDIRVVLNWDANNTDIDLWVTDPTGEKCFYSHNRTKIGGFMTNDFTQGYGPEVFLLKKGMQGKYKIQANYYGNNSSKVTGPVTLKMQFYTNYGKENQQIKETILRLKDAKEVIEIAEIEI